MNEDLTLCPKCNCMTKSIRKARAHFVCGKCGNDKTLGDFYQYELKNKKSKDKCIDNKEEYDAMMEAKERDTNNKNPDEAIR